MSVSSIFRDGQRIYELLRDARNRRGTDLHLKTGESVFVRIDKQLVKLRDVTPPTAEEIEAFLQRELDEAQLERFRGPAGSGDGIVASPEFGRARLNAARYDGGTAIALRLISEEIFELADLGLTEAVMNLAHVTTGLVVLTAPKGNGKSTLLASILDRINKTRTTHIVTVEDPVEQVIPPVRASIQQRSVGSATDSFAEAVRTMRRQDWGVAAVGELRDLDTTEAAVKLAGGGVVYTTMQTRDTVSAIELIVDSFPTNGQNQVRAELSQWSTVFVSPRLLPRAGGGLTFACEVLHVDSTVRALIREARSLDIRAQVADASSGNTPLERDLARLVKSDTVSEADALLEVNDRDAFERALNGGRR